MRRIKRKCRPCEEKRLEERRRRIFERYSEEEECNYRAVLFAADGDWVTDFCGETIEDVIKQLEDRGSRWIFYPIEAIIEVDGINATSHWTSPKAVIVDAAPGLENIVGHTIKDVQDALEFLFEKYTEEMEEEFDIDEMIILLNDYFGEVYSMKSSKKLSQLTNHEKGKVCLDANGNELNVGDEVKIVEVAPESEYKDTIWIVEEIDLESCNVLVHLKNSPEIVDEFWSHKLEIVSEKKLSESAHFVISKLKHILETYYEDWFRNLWENNASEEEFYELAKEIDPDITFREFDEAWQWRTILHENYEQAKIEFINALAGIY